MQNRYTGDAGDYGKYGLLRTICGHRPDSELPKLSLGVLWYLTPDETHNQDGKHVSYLQPTPANAAAYAACDPALHHELRRMVATGDRNVAAVRNAGIFDPTATSYFEEQLNYPGITASQTRITWVRHQYRKEWLSRAFRKLRSREVIFMDPDKSVEPKQHPGHKDGHQYAYLDDIHKFIGDKFTGNKARTAVIYHHTDRSDKAEIQIRKALAKVNLRFGVRPTAMLYRHGSARFFIIIPAPQHETLIQQRLSEMLLSPWGKRFSLHTL